MMYRRFKHFTAPGRGATDSKEIKMINVNEPIPYTLPDYDLPVNYWPTEESA